MRVDWIIATVTFIMFVSWAFSYYSGISAGELLSKSASALSSADSIIAYMTADTLTMPANISSASAAQDVTVWAYVNWTGGMMNSTRVVAQRQSTEDLYCMVSGDRLYWRANLTSGENYFFIEQADVAAALNCNGTLSQSDENQTATWAGEPGRAFSSAMNSQVCSGLDSDYVATKSATGSLFDFNVLIEEGNASTECGPPLPPGRDVFAFPYSRRLYEGGQVNVTVRLWQ